VDREAVLRRSAEPLAPEWGEGLGERIRREIPLITLDLTVALLAYFLPLALRFDGVVPLRYWSNFWRFLPLAFAIHLAANHFCGLYGQMWRYASVQEARRIVLAGAIGGGTVIVASMAISLAGIGLRTLPLSVVTFGAVLTMLGSGAIRFQSRLLAARRLSADHEWSRVLIVGAGDAGSMLLKDLLNNPSVRLLPVGMIDDDRRKVGRRLHSVPVVGTITALPRLVDRFGVDMVLLAIPSATSALVREVAALCERAHVTLKVLPSVQELVGGAACDVGGLDEVAKRSGIRLFFDAAHAFGSRRAGTMVGGFGDAEVFSLSPTKVLIAGEGGIIATNDDTLAERCRIGRDYGNPGDYDTRFVGLNARMSELHAATALASFEDLEERIARRNELAERYCKTLGDLPGSPSRWWPKGTGAPTRTSPS
jgi:hypothetical protein